MSQDLLEKYRLLLSAVQTLAEDDDRLSQQDFVAIQAHLYFLQDALEHPTKLKLVTPD